MQKYSLEFKLQVIKYYLEEKHTYPECCKKFNIPDHKTIRSWIYRYNLYGIEGIKKQVNLNYDGKFKQYVIEYMHNNHLSATETANYFKLGGSAVVLRWNRIYCQKGPQSLYKEQRGRPKKMKSKLPKKKDVNKNEDLLKELEYLRMENEYLKKLNALVQERVKRENKKK